MNNEALAQQYEEAVETHTVEALTEAWLVLYKTLEDDIEWTDELVCLQQHLEELGVGVEELLELLP